jgi:tetratricopeptide (TPR) repeat protein
MSDTAAPVMRGLDDVEMVGRVEEMAALDAALERAVRFKAPQLVTVVGPTGIGKSRLCREWLKRPAAPARRIVSVGAPERDASAGEPEPFGLIAAMLRQRFGLAGLDREGAALLHFRDELQRVFGDRRIAEVAALLGGFVGFEMPESPLSQALSRKPEQGIDLARAVLCRFMEQDAAETPLVLLFEDLQRADDRSLDILQDLAAELGEAPIVMVSTARPELLVRRPGWGHVEGSHTRVDLGPLPRQDLDRLMRLILSDDELVPSLVERAMVESGGSPFMLGQLLRVYQQHGILTAEPGRGWWIDVERAERETMAMTPEEAAQKRVAALSAAERDVLARAATFGEVFWTGGAVALGRLGVEPRDGERVFAPDPAIAEIRQMLENLQARDYVVRRPESSIAAEFEWAFRHPLERGLIEAAVDPGLMRRRKSFAAQWLESHVGTAGSGDAAAGTTARDRELRLEQLGRLYEEAGDARRAAYCFITAGGQARARLLLVEARALYRRGIGLLGIDDAVAKMDALHAVGDLTARLGRTREAIGDFQEMLRLAWRLDLPAKGGAAHDRLGRLYGVLGEHRAALGHLELARELFQLAGDLPGIASTLDDIGRIHFLAGAPEASLQCHGAALAVRTRLGDDRGRALALARMGQVEHETGELAAAAAHFREALELRRKVGDRQGEVCSLLDLGGLERDLGHLDRALALLDEGRTLAREIGERLFECSLAIEIGDCRLSEGAPRAALAEFSAAGDIARKFGAKLLVCEATRGIAEAELALGESVNARNQARAAFEIAQKIGAPPLAGAALRVAAAAVGQGAPGDAELGGAREMFDRAVEILGNAGAELELGRTLAAYADLEEQTGRRDAALELRRQAGLIRDRARRPGRTRSAAPDPTTTAAAIEGG